jgi:ABC-type lipoprotein release transport system permease subunit
MKITKKLATKLVDVVFAGMLAFIIAQLTVSFQVMKAARKNPVESLQYE